MGNGGIQPMYIVYLVLVYYILGTTSRLVGVACHLVHSDACLFTVHSYAAVVTSCLELRLVWLILIPIRTLEDGIGREFWQWRTYMYLLFVSYFGA